MPLIRWPTADLISPDFGQHNLTPVILDELAVAIAAGIALVLISFLFILPSFRLTEKSIVSFVGAYLGLFVLAGILLSQYGYNWAEAKITTRTPYKAFSSADIVADIGIRIGLDGVNITLEGIPHNQLNETINYNEHYSWEWHQHREGFSKYAGRINQDYRAGLLRGVPIPISWIAEYFVLDGEEIVWGRFYRSAGYYVHSSLWFALRCWVMAVILSVTNLKYSGYFFIMTAAFILLCNVLYTTIIATPSVPFAIPFPDGQLSPQLGWTFYLNLASGLVSFTLGVIILFYTKRNLRSTRSEWLLKANVRTAPIGHQKVA